MRQFHVAAALSVALLGCGGGATQSPPSTEGMVLVPAGFFRMGCDAARYSMCEFQASWSPPHDVALPDFYIDEREVTDGQYTECVTSNACTPALVTAPVPIHPVRGVSWQQATEYCT